MFPKNKNILISSGLILLLLYSCANIGTPTGGAYDMLPPQLERISPKAQSLNVKTRRITFEFDENVILDNPTERIIITPPQKLTPVIRAGNKKITVALRDSLISNTTYTIDFTDAIRDNNEGNILENYSYSFSTGDHIDSLSISGLVLAANNLEPIKGMFIGIHSDLADSAFTTKKFDRISKTNDFGQYTIRGIAQGDYKIYALNDLNRDYAYDNPDEDIAFSDSIISPIVIRDIRNDTIKHIHGDLAIDSIKTVQYNRYLPDDVILRSFKSDFRRKYLIKSERLDSTITVYFGAATQLPQMKLLNSNLDISKAAILEKSIGNDTINYWLNDKELLSKDTLEMQISYLATDTLNIDQLVTDTIKFFDRTRKRDLKPKKKKEEDKEIPVELLGVKTNMVQAWDIFKKIEITFDQPIKTDLLEHLKLEKMTDSVYHSSTINLEIDSLNPRLYRIVNKWDFGEKYKLSLDSASIYSIYGRWNDKMNFEFGLKNRDEYGNLAIKADGLNDSIPAFLELLNKSDEAVAKAELKNGVAIFRNVIPEVYYLRLIVDKNNNGKWDTGDYKKKLQAEDVYYYNGFFDIKSNFDIEQPWLIDTENIQNQKPLDITKNKPKDEKSKQEQMEERETQRQRQNERGRR